MDMLRFVCFFSLRPKVGEIIGDNLSTMYLLCICTRIYVYIYTIPVFGDIGIHSVYISIYFFRNI